MSAMKRQKNLLFILLNLETGNGRVVKEGRESTATVPQNHFLLPHGLDRGGDEHVVLETVGLDCSVDTSEIITVRVRSWSSSIVFYVLNLLIEIKIIIFIDYPCYYPRLRRVPQPDRHPTTPVSKH